MAGPNRLSRLFANMERFDHFPSFLMCDLILEKKQG